MRGGRRGLDTDGDFSMGREQPNNLRTSRTQASVACWPIKAADGSCKTLDRCNPTRLEKPRRGIQPFRISRNVLVASTWHPDDHA